MSDPIHVLVLTQAPMPEELLAPVRAASPRVRLKHVRAERLADLDPVVWSGVEVLYTTGLVPAAEQAPGLRWIQGHFAGIDHVASAPILQQAMLTTTSGIHVVSMAEYVVLMMLALAHHLPEMSRVQAGGVWPDDRWRRFAPRELRGCTVGIAGYGSIGREVARLARALGMRVVATKRDPEQRADTGWQLPGTGDPSGELVDRLCGMADLPTMLAEADYVVLLVPLTPKTRHLIDAAALAAMRPDACLINVGRGGLVDEAALVDALRAGRLAGAALDVFEREPLPETSPLWRLPNAILTPHVSGMSLRYDERAMALFAENLRRYAAGEPLLNAVDRELGY